MESLDRYAEALQAQNAGGVCPDCKASLGHFVMCPLINRAVAEAQSTELNRPDADWLGAMNIKW